jgi:hypothetical protein
MMTIGIAPARNAEVQRRLVTIVLSNPANRNRHDVSGASGLAKAIQPKATILSDKINIENGDLIALELLESKVSKIIENKYIPPQMRAVFIL